MVEQRTDTELALDELAKLSEEEQKKNGPRFVAIRAGVQQGRKAN